MDWGFVVIFSVLVISVFGFCAWLAWLDFRGKENG